MTTPRKKSPQPKRTAKRTTKRVTKRRDAARRSTPTPSAPSAAASPYRDAERGIRLQKAMADLGVASRRDCEALIEAGRVRINGQVIDALPAWVNPAEDAIEVDGQRVNRPSRARGRDAAGPLRHTTLMVHKPRNVISTSEDPEGRRRVIDLIDAELPGNPRLFPVGRLDADSTGLILLTDHGELANRLTHPRYEVPKSYEVSVRGRVAEPDLDKLRKGLYLATAGVSGKPRRAAGAPPAAKKAAVEHVRIAGHQTDRERGDRTVLHITLREGQNREIRRMLARLGFQVRRLKRVAIGPLKLKGLAPGQWRTLTTTELHMLHKAAGLDRR
jgi:23S rRNA pseudouridine2605 synthase